MLPQDRKRLRKYLQSLKEVPLQDVIAEFFLLSGIQCQKIHGPGEHGIDLIAHVDKDSDPLNHGYNILIQVKPGDISQKNFHEILGQLVEGTYYPFSQPPFDRMHARRVVLVHTGKLPNEASNSIREFNEHHALTLEYLGLDALIDLFETNGYATQLLSQITELGTDQGWTSPLQPSLGDPFDDESL